MKKIILSLAIALGSLCSIPTQVNAQIIRTVAGINSSGHSGDGGPAIRAMIGASWGVAQDTAGNIYLADDDYNMIRKITPDGTITTIAGISYSYGGYTGDGGPATAARLNYPSGMAIDRRGNLYFADNGNFAIRKISPSGIISTFAGDGSGDHSTRGDGGPATNARMMGCIHVAVDKIGNVYFTDGNTRIRKVDTFGIITTIAGTSAVGYAGNGVPATSAALYGPCGIVVDTIGNIYFSDQNNGLIRKINTSGIISNFAGQLRTSGFAGDGGPATSAKLSTPAGMAIDRYGNIYVADQGNGRIRKITPSGIISTVAGSGSWTYSGDGGLPVRAGMKVPSSLCIAANGNMIITDRRNYAVREIRQPAAVTITASAGTTICTGSTNVFTAPGRCRDLGLIHEWRVNGTVVGTDSVTFATSTLNNGDVVSYKLIDPLGHFTIDSCNGIMIAVNPILTPAVTVTKTTTDTICNGTAVTYLANPVSGGSSPAYEWRVNGSLVGTGSNYTYFPAHGDIVRVTLTSSVPCPSTNPVNSINTNMTVRPTLIPAVSVSGATSVLCHGTAVTYTATGTNEGTSPTYRWKKFGTDVGTGTSYSYVPSNGDYITCELTSNAICRSTNTVSTSNTITVNPGVTPSVDIVSVPANRVSFAGQLVTFYSEVTYGGSGVTYQWYENGTLIPGATSATFSKRVFTTDSVKCMITSSLPCTANPTSFSNSLTIVANELDVKSTSAFENKLTLYPNPNNGSFILSGTLDTKNAKDASYQVFNIAGQLIAEGKIGTQQQSLSQQIDLGKDMQPGQYLIKINTDNEYKLINFVINR